MSEDHYHGLKHLSPEMVRLIRGAIDNGVTREQLLKTLADRIAEAEKRGMLGARTLIDGAIGWMIEHPRSGVVKWLYGKYVFRDED